MVCINRNILECKEESPTFAELGTSVLIETYWNVKEHGHITSRSGCSGINRNILECKDRTTAQDINSRVSINRNILECKDNLRADACEAVKVLIETYWNVKTKKDTTTSVWSGKY